MSPSVPVVAPVDSPTDNTSCPPLGGRRNAKDDSGRYLGIGGGGHCPELIEIKRMKTIDPDNMSMDIKKKVNVVVTPTQMKGKDAAESPSSMVTTENSDEMASPGKKGNGDVSASTRNDDRVMKSNATPSRTRVKGGSDKTEDAD
jgi:hypothetical protein